MNISIISKHSVNGSYFSANIIIVTSIFCSFIFTYLLHRQAILKFARHGYLVQMHRVTGIVFM